MLELGAEKHQGRHNSFKEEMSALETKHALTNDI